MPRWAILAGRRVRVLDYRERDVFRVLDSRDVVRFVHRDRLTFLPGLKRFSGL